jgi:hypothetical protein
MSGERCCAWATGLSCACVERKASRAIAFIGINPTIQKYSRDSRLDGRALFILRAFCFSFSFVVGCR